MARVSVIMPAFNHGDTIGETLESLAAQTMQDFEAVVVDDGSTDKTSEAVAQYAPRVGYVFQENKGCAGACNRGLRETCAPYVLILGADDTLAPNALKLLAGALDAHPEASLAYGDYDRFGELATPGTFFQEHTAGDGMIAARLLARFSLTAACSVMFRRECLARTGAFDENLRFAEDTDFWLRACALFPAVFVPAVVSHVRVTGLSKHRNPATAARNCEDKARIVERFVREHPEVAAQLSHSKLTYVRARPYFDAGVWALRHRLRRKARSFLRSFLAKYKFYPQGYWYYLLSFLPWAVVGRFAGRADMPHREPEQAP